MTTITVDDDTLTQVIAVGHYQNAQEAVTKILADYLQQHNKQASITDLLAMPNVADIDFDPPHLTNFYPADLS